MSHYYYLAPSNGSPHIAQTFNKYSVPIFILINFVINSLWWGDCWVYIYGLQNVKSKWLEYIVNYNWYCFWVMRRNDFETHCTQMNEVFIIITKIKTLLFLVLSFKRFQLNMEGSHIWPKGVGHLKPYRNCGNIAIY